TYHLHYKINVLTKVGMAWVNPYMSLVLAYERQIGGRGTEIGPGDPVPPVRGTPVLLENAPDDPPSAGVRLPPERPARTVSLPEPKPAIVTPEKTRKPARKTTNRARGKR